jgi:hypothetical protein
MVEGSIKVINFAQTARPKRLIFAVVTQICDKSSVSYERRVMISQAAHGRGDGGKQWTGKIKRKPKTIAKNL